MTYTRVRNQELSITFKPTSSLSDTLFSNSNELFKDIEELLKKKYPDEFFIKSQEKVGIDFFTKKLIYGENFTFVKYGDGEIICMIGGTGKNCDDHPYSKKLGSLLEQSFVKLLRNYNDVYLAEWVDNLVKTRESYVNTNKLNPKFADYECFLTLDENMNDKKLVKFYQLIKNSKRKKIFVGPKKLKEVSGMLNLDEFIEVPLIDAFSKYDEVLKKLLNLGVEDDNIYILCCSMMSCLICSDLKEINNNITLLDIGSGFDPIFGEKTRPKQPSAEKCFKYYEEILPKDYKFNKTSHAINSLNKMLTTF
jgi:hypothetical protein